MFSAKFGPQWFWRRFFNFINVFLLYRYYLSLEKGRALHLNKLESPSPKDALCQVWLKLAQWFWRRRWKCEKFTDGRTTDTRRSEKLDHLFNRWRSAGPSASNALTATSRVVRGSQRKKSCPNNLALWIASLHNPIMSTGHRAPKTFPNTKLPSAIHQWIAAQCEQSGPI